MPAAIGATLDDVRGARRLIDPARGSLWRTAVTATALSNPASIPRYYGHRPYWEN